MEVGMMTPVIGIPQMGWGLFRGYMKSKYVQSLHDAGAQVRWISLKDTEKAISELMECDGLLLPGGPDVDPRLYGQEPTEKCGKPNPLRDTVEMKMLDAFLPTNKPILCICRGVQLLNVYFGGTLYQDISKNQACKHSHFRSRSKGCHRVHLQSRTNLRKMLGEEWIKVNSMHHQAVERVGPGLTVNAVSQDGHIEGLEVFLHPFCIGVQWHPEHMSRGDSYQQKLFQEFVSACQKND